MYFGAKKKAMFREYLLQNLPLCNLLNSRGIARVPSFEGA